MASNKPGSKRCSQLPRDQHGPIQPPRAIPAEASALSPALDKAAKFTGHSASK